MTLTIATSAVPGDLPIKLQAIAAAGFSGVELCEQDFTCFDGSARDVAKIATDCGLSIHLLQPFANLEGFSGSKRAAAFDRLERAFDRMEALGTKLLLVNATTDPDADASLEAIERDLAELAERAGKRGFRAAYLALPWSTTLTRETDALGVIEAVNRPELGLCLNSFFSLADGSRPARLGQIPGNRVFHVQLSRRAAP